MAKNTQNIQASILDRLIDLEPQLTREPVQKRLVTFDEIRNAVIRDLENLLNTKSQILPIAETMKNLKSSVFSYGLPDYSALNPKSSKTKSILRQGMETAISMFEPRLRNVSVRIESATQESRNVRFKINALLMVDPFSEPIFFDTLFDLNKGEYRIPK